MQPVNLFNLATQQANWLSVRQAAVAGNIANANTPGYSAVDVVPFETVLDSKPVALGTSHPKHISFGGQEALTTQEMNESAPIMPSGNTVVLENALMKAGEVRRGFELNTAIVKAFHRMIMMTTRG